ncbi:MAG: hypothetical protein IT364_17320 [Candidatus Hydrogenedentes bacterium]|nr:hypothetical protein [Candidatus Hydrogenedentota bacterium]
MWHHGLKRNEGVTLMELTFAVALFSVVLGATAQSLISYYVALDTQNQRHTAIRNCTGIVSNMRDVRDANPESFPEALTSVWLDSTEVAGVGTLPQEVITVDYVDPNANPLEVTVTSEWVDLRGRPMTVSVSTLLTDR